MNLLYVMTDQQRYDTLGSCERTPCRTPRLDALAEQGVRFDTAYSVCTLCSPARASMLTGLYPHNHGMRTNNDMNDAVRRELPDEVRLISQDLAEAGYNCGYVGKWHCGTEKVPSSFGFEGMDVPDYGSPWATDEYRDYLDENGLQRPRFVDEGGGLRRFEGPAEASEPFFLANQAGNMLRDYSRCSDAGGEPFMVFLSFWGPHMPYDVPEPWASMYDPAAVEFGPDREDDLQGKPCVQRRFRETCGSHDRSEEEWRRAIARYWGYCALIDEAVGRLLDLLDELGRAEDTAVLFSTDHGNMIGSHGGFYDKGPFTYEETYHIPLICRVPGAAAAGAVCDGPVTNMDLATTALDLAGVVPARDHDGRSLVPLLDDPQADWPDYCVSEWHGHRFLYTQRMVRWGRYKYVFNPADVDELYDLEEDPHELDNRAPWPKASGVLREGRKRLLEWMEETGDGLLAATRGMLRA